jgi:hypothetical protein
MTEQTSTSEEGQTPTETHQGQTPNPPEGQTPSDQQTSTTPPAEGQAPPTWDMVRTLRHENRATRIKLQEFEEAQMTEKQKLEKRAAEAEAKASKLERQALRYEVAAVKGIDADLLHGDSREELEANADKLLAWKQTHDDTPPPSGFDFGAGARPPANGETGDGNASFNAMLRRSAGRQR